MTRILIVVGVFSKADTNYTMMNLGQLNETLLSY